ncbi:hypothetical protein [Clostridium senegalense]|uniref:Uncharacterized protein n=1 Tax=Clostridium senegalense TaxID=1465809 RepID=A0A6M0H4T8_9CLOT|nr:hypothetical protein [Clostridium senegalense]NEU04891.1 hypothetical protein [Clostridium senegalense]
MAKCPLLSTIDEDVECFKECDLYKWEGNDNKCPFIELKKSKKALKHICEYEAYKEDKTSPISILYSDDYIRGIYTKNEELIEEL